MSVLDPPPPFACRPLDPFDLPEAQEVAAATGPHGVYVRNSLVRAAAAESGESAARTAREESGTDQVYALHGAERMLGLVFFGARGNLIVVERDPVAAVRLCTEIRSCPWEWRIALTRPEVADELRVGEPRPPLVSREQVYYGADRADVTRDLVSDEVRLATKRDAKVLIEAALDLNESDLSVARWRVNRTWLRDTVKRRIRFEQTYVIGPVGAPVCKLDLGSVGAAGVVLEGVHTEPAARGRGLASTLVATVMARFLDGEVDGLAPETACLHVGGANAAARRAYERAGMTERGRCHLLLRS